MTTPPQVPGPRRRQWPWIVCLVVVLPVLAVLAWYLSVRMANDSAVRRLEANARQRGEPLTLEELQLKYSPVPEDENAAVLLLRLWQKEQPEFWTAFLNGERPLPQMRPRNIDASMPFIGAKARRVPRGQPLSQASRAAAESHLREQSAHMQEVRTALQRPQCRFPLQFTNGLDTLLPHLARIKAEAQNFEIEALVAAERGEIDAAIEALHNAHRAGRLIADEPCLISQLVRISCDLIALGSAEQLLSRQHLSSAQLEKLQSILESFRMTNAATLALMGERAMFLSVFERPPRAVADSDSTDGEGIGNPEQAGQRYQMGMQLMKNLGLMAADKRLMLETFEEVIVLSEQDTPESITQTEQVFQRVREHGNGFPPKIFSRLLLPSIERARHRFVTLEGRRRAAVTAVAVERYRNEHGQKLPDGLDPLVPKHLAAVPLDPFDGKPIRFRALAKGFIVYSVGTDRTDDEGKERPARSGAKGFDDVFTVER